MAEVHLVATAFMAGLIVFVQVVHYPLMAKVGDSSFVAYEAGHTVRTGWVVIPPMVTELGSAVMLVTVGGSDSAGGIAWLGLGLLIVVWGATALIQAPAHGRLGKGFDPAVHRKLVRTNWIRTVAWLARVPVAVALLG
jgi:hypothetical protein